MAVKTFFVTLCNNAYLYAYYLKTAQPISMFFTKNGYLIFRQLHKKRVKNFYAFEQETQK